MSTDNADQKVVFDETPQTMTLIDRDGNSLVDDAGNFILAGESTDGPKTWLRWVARKNLMLPLGPTTTSAFNEQRATLSGAHFDGIQVSMAGFSFDNLTGNRQVRYLNAKVGATYKTEGPSAGHYYRAWGHIADKSGDDSWQGSVWVTVDFVQIGK